MNLLLLVLSAIIGQIHPVAEIDTILREGITAGVYPGAVVVIGTRDTVLMARGYGHLTWSAEAETPAPGSTLYDLASLTKVVATTGSVMLLVDRGLVALEDPVGAYVADFHGPHRDSITVGHLLTHTSGLRAFLPLNTLTHDAASARRAVVTEVPKWPVGSRVEYSDLNAILLGWVVEGATSMSLDVFAGRELFRPLVMADTRFRLEPSQRARAAPINVWRGHVIAGVVHDQNAERLGGVSGHAGLYSTGLDLARYAQLYLSGGATPSGRALVRPATIERFVARHRGNRALGWEVNDTTSTDNTGAALSSSAFGHGGFTGTSMWIDPEQNLFVILLTNRVYAPRTRRSITRLKEIRGRLADSAVSLKERACRILALASRSCE